jgi:hypothetical protein
VPALAWAALDLLRSPAELALSLAAVAGVMIAAGYLVHKSTDDSRKDG